MMELVVHLYTLHIYIYYIGNPIISHERLIIKSGHMADTGIFYNVFSKNKVILSTRKL